MTGIFRNCVKCGERYELDSEELADGTYSPLCDRCLRQAHDSNRRLPREHREKTLRERVKGKE